jgi:hypothetical protein
MDVKKALMLPFLPVARKGVEVEFGTVKLSETLPFAASLLLGGILGQEYH